MTPYFKTIFDILPHFAEGDTSLRTLPHRIAPPLSARLDDVYDTLPFWVEESIPHAGLNESAKQKFFHWGPDTCLVVRRKGLEKMGASYGDYYPVK